jgi:hypothetical protein
LSDIERMSFLINRSVDVQVANRYRKVRVATIREFEPLGSGLPSWRFSVTNRRSGLAL